uniref:interleukin-13 receptor subunit alpha-1-like isoform X2 n=1 Tax=Doryrhamphus excisus TaxID=161450 RepID=UPI0025AE5AB3|nr:interleukin-13 receptor subunit alpha-1-like isoform X2 [Doryrhamphus excisus]
MSFTILAFCSCCFLLCSLHAEAGRLPAPVKLSHKWLDPFTVNVSWLRPRGLPDHCNIRYKYGPYSSTEWRNITMTLLTEKAGSSGWPFAVQTVSVDDCKVNESTPAVITIHAPQARAQLVKDFKCLLQADKMDCYWIPIDPFVNLTLSYRICGDEDIGGLQVCEEPYHRGVRNGCYLSTNFVNKDICMLLSSQAGISTFQPKRVVSPPTLSYSVDGNKLNLSWTTPEVLQDCSWVYELCYKGCSESHICETFYIASGQPRKIAYDQSCSYELRSRVVKAEYCHEMDSDYSTKMIPAQTPGKSPSVTLIVVAIVVPLVLCFVIFLLTYCIRRHSAILYPAIPDPSVIFKTEIKTLTNLYTPVPEPVEPCKIIIPQGHCTSQVTNASSGLIQQNLTG